jgi:hypothetical protein
MVTRTCIVTLLLTAAGLAQTYSFESGEEGWIGLGPNARVHVTKDAANVKSGRAALAFDYKIAPKQFSAAVLPVEPGSIAALKRVHFWIKTDISTAVAILLSEKKPGGGDYTAWAWSPKGRWNEVQLNVSDFVLNDAPTDPKDLDGKLDLDQVQGIGVIDISQMFAAMADSGNAPFLVDKTTGEHTLYIDDFQLLSDAGAAAPKDTIDDFGRPGLRWLTPGGANLVLTTAGPLKKPSLEASYAQVEGEYSLIMHRVANMEPDATGLSFDFASLKDARITITVEERTPGSNQGPRFNYTLDAPAGKHPVHTVIPFADFRPESGGEARPDPAKLKSIAFIDLTAANTNRNERNTLWLADLKVTKKP